MNRPAGRRAVVGPALVVVGAAHTGLTPLLHREAVRGVLSDGVLNGVEADPGQVDVRALGFWFATTGIGLSALGWAVTVVERRPEPLPRALPAVLLGLGVWGVVLLPRSPFWVLPTLGLVAELRRRRERR
jgi:hypothetical protein